MDDYKSLVQKGKLHIKLIETKIQERQLGWLGHIKRMLLYSGEINDESILSQRGIMCGWR